MRELRKSCKNMSTKVTWQSSAAMRTCVLSSEQRATAPPPIFSKLGLMIKANAVIRLLFLMSQIQHQGSSMLKAFVLDFTQAFWQIPICPGERNKSVQRQFYEDSDAS